MGQFGSALAQIYEKQGFRVLKIAGRHSRLSLLPKKIKECVSIICTPTQEIPEVLVQRGDLLDGSYAVISAAKGIIQKTGQTPSQYISTRISGKTPILAISGPSFASELKKGLPTALVLAGRHKKKVDYLAETLSTPQLRLYKSLDPIGVEYCGALKNIYAIGAGCVEGLNLGLNSRMALTTRALAEMSLIGKALGGHSFTFFGLAGVGDLFLTCSSEKSRNFRFGEGLAKRKKPSALLKELGTVEGYWTAQIAYDLCRKLKLRTPVLDVIVSIIDGKLQPQKAATRLMARENRYEF